MHGQNHFKFISAFTAHTRTFPTSVSNVHNRAAVRTLQHALTNDTEHHWLPSQTFHVFAPSYRLHAALCSLLSLFHAGSQFQQSRWALNSNTAG